MARRVLIIAYYFPPVISSGTSRSLAFARLLPAEGWDTTILTVKSPRDPWVGVGNTASIEPSWKVVRSHEWNLLGVVRVLQGFWVRIARLFGRTSERNRFYDWLCLPDAQAAWSVLWPARKLARDCDVIYVSCSPFSASVKAVLAGLVSKTPVVVDFRDAWSMNPHITETKFRAAVIRRLERFVVRRAAALILNTPGARRLYEQAYPHYREKFHAIPNGFDSLPPPVKRRAAGDVLTLMHVGQFYGTRNPRRLLEAMVALGAEKFRFIQIGEADESFADFTDRLQIESTGRVSREEALDRMNEADVLYLRQGWEAGVNDYVAVAAKTYEYLATGLPILAECPPGDNLEVVRQCGGEAYIADADSDESVRSALAAAWEARGTWEPHVSEKFIHTYARPVLARRLAEVLTAAATPQR